MLGPERAKRILAAQRAASARVADEVPVDELADWLGVSVRTVWEWRRLGVLPEPMGKRGRRAVWSRQMVAQAIEEAIET